MAPGNSPEASTIPCQDPRPRVADRIPSPETAIWPAEHAADISVELRDGCTISAVLLCEGESSVAEHGSERASPDFLEVPCGAPGCYGPTSQVAGGPIGRPSCDRWRRNPGCFSGLPSFAARGADHTSRKGSTCRRRHQPVFRLDQCRFQQAALGLPHLE